MQHPSAPRRLVVATATAVAVALLTSACQTGPAASTGGVLNATDDGTTVTMWTRSATSDYTQALVDAYNDSHENQVDLTVVPFDAYQQKVASAAGAGQLPDIVSSDVVFTPDYVTKGLFRDLTAEIDALPFADDLAKGHIAVGTSADGKKYAIPHDIDLSAMFYNKVLFKKAGLDPDSPPTDLAGWFDAARAMDGIDGADGFYFGGNCGGCMLFTTWPSIWADGGEVLNDDGTEAELDTDTASSVYDQYRTAWEEGLAPESAQTETGATFGTAFTEGKIGWQILGAAGYGSFPKNDTLDVGIAPVPGIDGGESTFLGGDTLSIASTSEKAAAAWDFLSWTIGDEAQIDVVAKGGALPSRTDLADNEYSTADPNVAELSRLVSVGQTPVSAAFGSTFNDANGPWTAYVRNQVFGDVSKRGADNDSISAALSQ